eukprot:394321_1
MAIFFLISITIYILHCISCNGYSANITSPPEVVYNWTSQHCPNGVEPYQWDVADGSVRAFRQNSKNITWLLAPVNLGSRANYVLNENLEISQANHSCNVYYNSTNNHNVSMFSDREWIFATFIMENSDTVHGLVHVEFDGWRDVPPGPGQKNCTNPWPACLFQSITTVVSYDGGLSWEYILPPPLHISAVSPYKFFYNQPPFGWGIPSNILYNKQDNYYYATATTETYGLQNGGTTIMRTNNLSIPNSWKCYNGSSGKFDVDIGTDPYTANNFVIEDHICTIITEITLPTLLWSEYYNKFLMVGTSNRWNNNAAFGFTLSADLIHWGPWSVIRKEYHPSNETYHEDYPSFIDPNCKNLNYDCAGKSGYLYYVVERGKINGTDILVRDIYRQQVEFM